MIIKRVISDNPLVIFLMGPTACGKSELAMQLRQLIPVELISVDSALIYREMNIGTAKPTDLELLHHPHYLINIKDPTEKYSVGEFQKDALEKIAYIFSVGKIPLLVGGTMFYFRTLLEGLPQLPPAHRNIRLFLYSMHKRNKKVLYNILKKIDFESAKRVHPNDLQRILRVLEVFLVSGTTLTELTKLKNYNFPYKVIQFSIMPKNQEWLMNSIRARFEKMLSLGFQNEVEYLLNRGDLNINLSSMHCVGYQQMWNYLMRNLSYDDMIHQSIVATKRLAKNQLTWLKCWKNLHKFVNNNNLDDLCEQIIKRLESL
ncbi:MAG: tRNA (adenosine(37)-N6)-dimethylallyltransferase MiaA [Buchnera aphidicola (Meitanaphis microgallis)]